MNAAKYPASKIKATRLMGSQSFIEEYLRQLSPGCACYSLTKCDQNCWTYPTSSGDPRRRL